jgi:hypothetical protein
VRENMPDVHDIGVEVNGGNDPVLVAANVKNVVNIDLISRVESRLEIRKLTESRDSTTLRQACNGSPASGWIAAKSVRAVLDMIRIGIEYLNLRLIGPI